MDAIWSLPSDRSVRHERHYGDRVFACYAPRPTHLHHMLAVAVADNPDGEAFVDAGGRVTYRVLGGTVEAAACGLAARGIAAGDRVAILVRNRIEFVVAVLAAIRLDAIAVPINVRESTEGLDFILNDCGAAALVHEADLAEVLPSSGRLPRVRFTVGGAAAGAEPFAALLDPAPPLPDPAAGEEDPCVLLYTSGTTGRPKGAMLTHLSIVHSVLTYRACLDLGSDDRSVLVVPASHVTGLVGMIFAMIGAAGALVMQDRFDAAGFLAVAARERITHTIMVPAMYNLCLLRAEFEPAALSRWRIGAYGGAPMPEATIAALAEALPGLHLVNAYGATETTSPTTIMPPGHTAQRPDSVGRVVPCGEVRIMDPDGREVPPGTDGEIWIAGPMVVPGYWNRPDATGENFVGGFWRSGDIGSLDADGYLRIHDRIKDMINRAGYKIYSVEVENVLAHHPNVAEIAAVPRPDPVLGERVHLFAVARSGRLDLEDLRRFAAGRLADYKLPEGLTEVSGTLPRNANGKVLKRELTARLSGPA